MIDNDRDRSTRMDETQMAFPADSTAAAAPAAPDDHDLVNGADDYIIMY